MAVLSNFLQKSSALPSLSFSLCKEARDWKMIEAQYLIDKNFNPAIPEMCFGVNVVKPITSLKIAVGE